MEIFEEFMDINTVYGADIKRNTILCLLRKKAEYFYQFWMYHDLSVRIRQGK